MNDYTEVLCNALRASIASNAKQCATLVRRSVPTASWTGEDHRALELAVESVMLEAVHDLFRVLDNHHEELPEGVLSFRIYARPGRWEEWPESEDPEEPRSGFGALEGRRRVPPLRWVEEPEVLVSDPDDGYAEMWRQYLLDHEG